MFCCQGWRLFLRILSYQRLQVRFLFSGHTLLVLVSLVLTLWNSWQTWAFEVGCIIVLSLHSMLALPYIWSRPSPSEDRARISVEKLEAAEVHVPISSRDFLRIRLGRVLMLRGVASFQLF